MKKKESLKVDYLVTPFMGILIFDGSQIHLVSSQGTKQFGVTSKKTV